MFDHLHSWARDDSVVKAVFDHVRNIGIAAGVGAASAWKLKYAAPLPEGAPDYLAALLLGALAVGLQWMNHENLFHKLRDKHNSIWVHTFVVLLYAIIVAELVRFAREGRVAA